MVDAALVVIARAPELGKVKTRLAASLGVTRTLTVYRDLLAVVVRTVRAWPGPVLLAADGEAAAWTGSGLEDLPRRPQPTGSLGARISAALAWGLEHAPHAIAIGTDCPGLSLAALHHVVAGLATAAVAFGPAQDGGYWSVAVGNAAVLPLITANDLPWSQPDLLDFTISRVAAAGHRHALGPLLADCDDADDLALAVSTGLLTWPDPHPLDIPR